MDRTCQILAFRISDEIQAVVNRYFACAFGITTCKTERNFSFFLIVDSHDTDFVCCNQVLNGYIVLTISISGNRRFVCLIREYTISIIVISSLFYLNHQTVFRRPVSKHELGLVVQCCTKRIRNSSMSGCILAQYSVIQLLSIESQEFFTVYIGISSIHIYIYTIFRQLVVFTCKHTYKISVFTILSPELIFAEVVYQACLVLVFFKFQLDTFICILHTKNRINCSSTQHNRISFCQSKMYQIIGSNLTLDIRCKHFFQTDLIIGCMDCNNRVFCKIRIQWSFFFYT